MTSPQGVIGCLDPQGGLGDSLARWAEGARAVDWCSDGPFRLWAVPGPGMRAAAADADGLVGMFDGDIYPAAHPAGGAAEAALAACRCEGAQFVWAHNGQFSLALWDRHARELLLFRDDSSARSLYFVQRPGGALAFATRLDLLIASGAAGRRLSRRSLHEYLRFLDVSTPNTIYEDVYSVEPGVLYRFGDRGLVRQEGPAAPPAAQGGTLEDAAGTLDRLVTDAVAARLAPEGTTVTFLSGGVDSSLLCAAAATLDRERIEALTVGFQETGFDESVIASRVAAHLGVRHHVLSYTMQAYRDAFESFTAGIEYPFADPGGVPSLLAFRAAREIGRVALDGTGADTLFGVMPARHQRLAVQFGALLPRRVRGMTARWIKLLPGLRGYAPVIDFDDPEEILIRWRGWSRSAIEDLCGEPVSLAHTRFYRLFQTFPREAHLKRYSALLGNLPDDRLHQAALLTGLDVRFPYFDRTVTGWVQALDQGLRYHPGEPKRVLKAVLARQVPRSLWDQPKHGFDFPFLTLMRADDCALVRHYLDPALTRRWGLFRQDRLEAAAAEFIHSGGTSAFADRSPAFRVWALVVLFAWLENHFGGR